MLREAGTGRLQRRVPALGARNNHEQPAEQVFIRSERAGNADAVALQHSVIRRVDPIAALSSAAGDASTNSWASLGALTSHPSAGKSAVTACGGRGPQATRGLPIRVQPATEWNPNIAAGVFTNKQRSPARKRTKSMLNHASEAKKSANNIKSQTILSPNCHHREAHQLHDPSNQIQQTNHPKKIEQNQATTKDFHHRLRRRRNYIRISLNIAAQFGHEASLRSK